MKSPLYEFPSNHFPSACVGLSKSMKRFIILTLGVIASFAALPTSADAAVVYVSSSSHPYYHGGYSDVRYHHHYYHHRGYHNVYHRGYYSTRYGHRVWVPGHTVVVRF